MRFLRTLWAIISARWFVSLLGVILLALLIWFLGDLLQLGGWQPLGSDSAKLVAILVIVFLWGVSNLYAQRRARRANEQMVEALSTPASGHQPAADEIDELSRRFQDALARLQKRRFKQGGRQSRQYLYQLPWYIVIGPPGSGKSTLLENSGLRFPLGKASGDHEFRGVGGTRNCDWFFTDEAVLIDTAGRYTTQDSRQEVDSAAWRGFLDLLKTHRPRQPINGVLVAISVEDLLQSGDQDGLAHARAIRTRLLELGEHLGIPLPVYLLLTKADLVAGFVEFFGDMDEAQREQVWGITLPYGEGKGAADQPALAGLGASFDRLVGRLHDRLGRRMHAARDLATRAAIYKFPAQVAALKRDLERFLAVAFGSSDYELPIKVRGIYLSSGVQQGLPIDRMMGAVADSFGLARSAPAATAGERSYFLTRMLREVVFAEASLVGSNPKEEQRRRRLLLAGYAALALITAGLIAGWWASYVGNRDRILATEQRLRQYGQEVAGVRHTQLSGLDRDLAPVLPLIDMLRELPAGYAERDEGDPLRLRFGLSQRGRLNDYGEIAYQHGLEQLFLPRLLLGEEQDLQASIADVDYVLPALKVYLMLGGQTEPDDTLITTWLNDGWRQLYPNADAGRQALSGHLDAVLDFAIRTYPPLDGNLISRARQTLTQISVARRAYDDFRQSEATLELPAWRLVDHAGPEARSVFIRLSGKDVNAGLPGLYTYQSFHDLVLPSLSDIARAAAAESWVLGVEDTIEISDAELQQLETDILRLYEDDYIRVWDEFLKDVTLAPLSDLDRSVAALNTLAGPSSPLKLLLQGIVTETRLTVVPEEPAEEGEGGQGGSTALKLAGKALGKYGKMLKKGVKLVQRPGADSGAVGAQLIPGQAVEYHFRFLTDIVEGVGGAPPLLDQPIAALGQARDLLQEIQINPNPDEIALQVQLDRIAAALGGQAGRLAEPLSGWLSGVAHTTTGFSTNAIRRQLNAHWSADVLPLCQTALQNRFPFTLSSTVDVSVDDFSRLFGPGGLIDVFFQNHLQQFVDTASRPWRWRADLGISNRVLATFEQAHRIQASLFAAGSVPSARFTLRAVELSARAMSVSLDLDGQTITYSHGPSRPEALQWPGPKGSNLIRLTFAPLDGGPPAVLNAAGTWSWFRLLHQAEFEATDLPDVFNVRLASGGHNVVYQLRAGSVDNPFDLRRFASFRCAGQL